MEFEYRTVLDSNEESPGPGWELFKYSVNYWFWRKLKTISPIYDIEVLRNRISYLVVFQAYDKSLTQELLEREKQYIFCKIQSLHLGKRFEEGDPVILPNIHDVKKPIHCTFIKYLTTSGSDRKVQLMVDGGKKEAWISFIVPDMTFWFREIV